MCLYGGLAREQGFVGTVLSPKGQLSESQSRRDFKSLSFEKRKLSPALEFRSWGQEGGGARPTGWMETPGCKLQGNWLMWYLVSSITLRWRQLGAVGGRGGLPKRKGRLRRGLRGRRLGGCRTGKGSELVQRKRERGCLALEGAAHGRRPEGFSCSSARAEALGKASKMPRLTLHKDLL